MLCVSILKTTNLATMPSAQHATSTSILPFFVKGGLNVVRGPAEISSEWNLTARVYSKD